MKTQTTGKKALFFFGSSKGTGLTDHFAYMAVQIYKKGKQQGIDSFLVSDKKEQTPGLWAMVEKNIPADYILRYDETDRPALVRLINPVFERYEGSVFHLQGIGHIRLAKPWLSRKNVRSVVTIHSYSNGIWWKKPIVSLLYSSLIDRYIDKAIFLSPFAMRGFVGSRYLRQKGKIVHIPFGLPALDLQYEYVDDNILSPDFYNVVYMANFFRNKGHERFLPALIQFAKENQDVRIYFFGQGKRREAVISKIRKSGMDKQLFCPGRIPRNKIPSVFKKTAVSLLLSGSENANHGAIESLMMGVPHISTRVGASEYFIQDYINGIGIDNRSGLLRALNLLKTNPELGKEMVRNGTRMIETSYGYETMLDAFYKLYVIL